MPDFKKRLLILLCVVAGGCSTARDPARGFRLAKNGDPERGKAAFVELGCTSCHEVHGASLPKPTVQPVMLGGPVVAQRSDGYLVAAIINPTYHAAHYTAAGASEGGPKMPEFASRMTVLQLTDIVTYLQSRYSISPIQPRTEFP